MLHGEWWTAQGRASRAAASHPPRTGQAPNDHSSRQRTHARPALAVPRRPPPPPWSQRAGAHAPASWSGAQRPAEEGEISEVCRRTRQPPLAPSVSSAVIHGPGDLLRVRRGPPPPSSVVDSLLGVRSQQFVHPSQPLPSATSKPTAFKACCQLPRNDTKSCQLPRGPAAGVQVPRYKLRMSGQHI